MDTPLRPRARLVTSLTTVNCPVCGGGASLASSTSSLSHFWNLDTRRIVVRCASCKQFFRAFAYPLFNWVPPHRIILGVAILNTLVAAFLFLAVS